jgi:membrane protein
MKRIVTILQEAATSYGAHQASRLAAGLAFYALFSLGPLVLLAVAVAGLLFGEDAALGLVSDQLATILGSEVAELVEDLVAAATTGRGAAIWVGLGLAVVTGSGVFLQLQGALNFIFGAEPERTAGVLGFIRQRLIAFGSAVSLGLILAVLLGVQAVIQYLGGGWIRVLGSVAALGLLTAVLAAMYQYLSAVRLSAPAVGIGAVFTALATTAGAFLVGTYLGRVAHRGVFAAVGSVAVLLYFIYLQAQVFLFGGELIRVLDRGHRFNSASN